MRLSSLPFLQTLAALAIAIASPGVEVGHGLAHEHEQEHEEAAHHDVGMLSSAHHSTDHPHERISQALRNRADVGEFAPLPPAQIVADLPAISVPHPVPVSYARPSGDRATGPPPRLRAPPID